MVPHEWLAFYCVFFVEYPLKWCTYTKVTALAWLVLHQTTAVSVQVLCTPYNYAPSHFMQSHIRKVCTCLAVTCHLHFWQNDWDLLCATAVTLGWNGYWNKSAQRRPWRMKFSHCSCRDLNPRPFSHESGTLTTELSSAPPPPPPKPLSTMQMGAKATKHWWKPEQSTPATSLSVTLF